MDKGRVRATVTVEDPNGKGAVQATYETNELIIGADTLTVWLGGDGMPAQRAYQQGVGSPMAVYPLAWVRSITFEHDCA